MEAKLGGGVREEEEKHTEQGESVSVGAWALGWLVCLPRDVFPQLSSHRLSPPAVTNAQRRGAHAEAHTHLAASVVGIAAETCEAEALIKTTDHR